MLLISSSPEHKQIVLPQTITFVTDDGLIFSSPEPKQIVLSQTISFMTDDGPIKLLSP